jgi:hypothetical protein
MKKVIFLALIAVILSANHINWYGNYNKALEIAKREKKPLFVMLIKSNSKACKSIIKDYFTNKKFIDEFNQKYISVIINYDNQDYPIEMFYSQIFPTFFIINPKNEIFIRKPLYKNQIKEFLYNNLF